MIIGVVIGLAVGLAIGLGWAIVRRAGVSGEARVVAGRLADAEQHWPKRKPLQSNNSNVWPA